MNAEGTPQIEMPRYRSHKTVWALKIATVVSCGTDTTTDENPIVELHFEDQNYAPRRINLCGKPTPEAGWYMVQYKEGYISFSPAKQFEEGNTLEVFHTQILPKPEIANLRSFPQDQINNWFTYHAPTPEQLVQYQEIRTAAKIFAETINRHVPAGADKSAAMRLVREATMTANAGVACDAPKPRPTIAELEKILNSEEDTHIEILADGSVRAITPPSTDMLKATKEQLQALATAPVPDAQA